MWHEDIDGPEPLTKSWFVRLKEKLARAPQGFWRATSDSQKQMIYLYESDSCDVLAEIENLHDISPNETGLAIADLLVEARNAIPVLIQETERLQEGYLELAHVLGVPASEATPEKLRGHLEQLKKELSDSFAEEAPRHHRNGTHPKVHA